MSIGSPHDDEMPGVVDADGFVVLSTGRVRVDEELSTLRYARRAEAPSNDVKPVSTHVRGEPDEDKASVGGDSRGALRKVEELSGVAVGIHPEFGAQGNLRGRGHRGSEEHDRGDDRPATLVGHPPHLTSPRPESVSRSSHRLQGPSTLVGEKARHLT